MERRIFIKNCSYTAVGLPMIGTLLQSCSAIYYATASQNESGLTLSKSEFWEIKKDKKIERKFVMIQSGNFQFPICLYKIEEDLYTASLLKCSHRGCELNVGGGIFSCPCHGSEFTIQGKVLEGPANEDLQTFITKTDNENIYITIS